ncbi:NADH-cytochrome b5 reductase 3-like [Amblyomma americanum]
MRIVKRSSITLRLRDSRRLRATVYAQAGSASSTSGARILRILRATMTAAKMPAVMATKAARNGGRRIFSPDMDIVVCGAAVTSRNKWQRQKITFRKNRASKEEEKEEEVFLSEAMHFSQLPVPRRPLLFAFVSVAAACGALALVVLLSRRLKLMLAASVLLSNRNAKYKVVLQQRHSLTHNVLLLRFALKSRRQKLGINPGQHVLLSAHIDKRVVARPYTPVSIADQRGCFDLVVKVYRAGCSSVFPNGGLMSQYLDSLAPGDSIEVQGPQGRFFYAGRGQFVFRDGHRLPLATRMGMIAAGSGITPMLQLLRHMVVDARDETSIVLVDVNSSEEDIIARDELDHYARRFGQKFSIWHVLSQLPAGGVPYNFLQGRLTKEILKAHLPPPHLSTLVLCCGPPSFLSEVCKPALSDIGHHGQQILIF